MGKNTHITFNVDAEDLRDANEFRQWREAAKPKYLFILNGTWLAHETKRLYPDCTIIHRSFDPFNDWQGGKNPNFDNTFWQNHSVSLVINRMKANLSKDKDFIHTVGYNEPSHNNNVSGKTLRDMLDWFIELMDKARENGFRLAIGEFASAKTIYPEDVASGIWDKWLQAVKRHAGWHIPTFHDYTTGILPATLMPNYPENLFNREALQESQWPKSLPAGAWGWHFLRHELLQLRSVELGLGRFEYAVTEFSWDMMADIDRHNQALSRLKVNYGMPEYNGDIRGVLAHRRYFEWVLGKTLNDVEFCAYAFAQSRWAANIYPDECLFQANFGWNKDWEIPEGADFSVPAMRPYRDMVANYAPSPAPAPVPLPVPMPDVPMIAAKIRAKDASGTLIRNAPSGAIIGKFSDVGVSGKIQADYQSVTWAKVEATGLVGYSATEWLIVETDSPKLYTLELPGQKLIVTYDGLQDMIAYQEILLTYLRSMLGE